MELSRIIFCATNLLSLIPWASKLLSTLELVEASAVSPSVSAERSDAKGTKNDEVNVTQSENGAK